MKRTVVGTTFPYSLKWDKGDLSVRINDEVFEVRFEKRYRQSTDQRMPGFGIVETTNLEYERDRLGRAAHTYIEIRFPMHVEYELDNQSPILNRVHAVINRILEVYRYTMGEFHVGTIPKNELHDYMVRTLNADGTFGDKVSMVSMPSGGWLTYVEPQPVPDETRSFLTAGTELPIPRVLYLNAKREEFYESYRLAVVEAETAFEALVDQVIAQYYRNKGLSKTQVDNKLKAPLQGAGGLIETHIPRCCGCPFIGTSEHAAWKSDLYQLRNDVVHDGVPVDANQARKALDAADKALQWITMHCV